MNPNVLSSVLLNHIRKTCGFEGIQENIDLASESGEVVDLVSKGKEYAKKYLEPRTTYIPVKVIGGEARLVLSLAINPLLLSTNCSISPSSNTR